MTKTPLKRQSLWRLLMLLKPKHKKYLAGLVSRAAMTTTERLVIAYLLKMLTDGIIAHNKAQYRSTLITWIVFYLGFAIVAPFILYLWRTSIFEGTAHIREAVFRHLQRLPMGYHEIHHSGNALSILSNDVSTAEKAYQEDLYTLVEATFQGVGAATFMLVLNWKLALVIVACGMIPLVINTLFAKPLRNIGQQVQNRLGTVSERMTDLLAGFQVIRTFNLGDWILARFDSANASALETSLQRVRLDAALASGYEFAGLSFFIPMAAGAYLVLVGLTTFGTYLALVQLSGQINYFVFALGGVISRIQAALAASDRIFELLDTPLEPERYSPRPGAVLPAATGGPGTMIEFKEVTFAYNGGGNTLNALSFAAPRGQFLAFAGPSGGGKSTLFKLLLGCYPINAGAVYVAGKSIHEQSLSELRERIAYVPQDAYLFSGSILDNIRYGKATATPAEIEAAAKAAFAHDFISEFPGGYQTIVGERGARLSGGQRQRIAIARALLKNAPILLLDEATSALDSESEQIVQQALEVLMKGRTTLVIAHRFSTIVHADTIFVVDGGKVVEQGKHSELMEKQGVYANLYEMQYQLSQDQSVTTAPAA